MSRSLWEIQAAIEDAIDHLMDAERKAIEASGYVAGRQADPDYGVPEIPEEPGWPAMVALADAMSRIIHDVKAALTPEIRDAIRAEADDDGPDDTDRFGY